jgi:hypothetical protein
MRIEGLDGGGLRLVVSHSCVEKPTHEWGTRSSWLGLHHEKQVLRFAYPTDDTSSAGPQACSAQDDKHRAVVSHSCVEKPTHEWGTQSIESVRERSGRRWESHSM